MLGLATHRCSTRKSNFIRVPSGNELGNLPDAVTRQAIQVLALRRTGVCAVVSRELLAEAGASGCRRQIARASSIGIRGRELTRRTGPHLKFMSLGWNASRRPCGSRIARGFGAPRTRRAPGASGRNRTVCHPHKTKSRQSANPLSARTAIPNRSAKRSPQAEAVAWRSASKSSTRAPRAGECRSGVSVGRGSAGQTHRAADGEAGLARSALAMPEGDAWRG